MNGAVNTVFDPLRSAVNIFSWRFTKKIIKYPPGKLLPRKNSRNRHKQ